MLGHYPSDKVVVNLAMLDPVPGNSILGAQLDILNLSLANQVMDLSNCHNLKNVICIYAHNPSDPDFYAPIRPTYPKGTLVEEDVIFGTHSSGESREHKNAEFKLVAPRFIEFMRKCGSVYPFHKKYDWKTLTPSKYQKVLEDANKTWSTGKKYQWSTNLPEAGSTVPKNCHAAETSRSQISFKCLERGDGYINQHHRFLATGQQIDSLLNSKQDIKPDVNTISRLKNLAQEILNNMTETSRLSTKGNLVISLINQLENENNNEVNMPDLSQKYLRMLVHISLQRDRYAYSLFTTTQSGEKLKMTLLKSEYQYFANLILGTSYDDGREIRYRDLRSFAGGLDEKYFNADNREINYAKINHELILRV